MNLMSADSCTFSALTWLRLLGFFAPGLLLALDTGVVAFSRGDRCTEKEKSEGAARKHCGERSGGKAFLDVDLYCRHCGSVWMG